MSPSIPVGIGMYFRYSTEKDPEQAGSSITPSTNQMAATRFPSSLISSTLAGSSVKILFPTRFPQIVQTSAWSVQLELNHDHSSQVYAKCIGNQYRSRRRRYKSISAGKTWKKWDCIIQCGFFVCFATLNTSGISTTTFLQNTVVPITSPVSPSAQPAFWRICRSVFPLFSERLRSLPGIPLEHGTQSYQVRSCNVFPTPFSTVSEIISSGIPAPAPMMIAEIIIDRTG